MLARAEDAVYVDAWIDLFAATARLAVKDFQAGPLVVGHRHFDTAERFLRESGLINRVPPPPAPVGPTQLDLFD